MTDVVRVKSVSEPSFSPLRHDETGAGWIVGANGVLTSDGTDAIHAHWGFETKAEADLFATSLSGKIIRGMA